MQIISLEDRTDYTWRPSETSLPDLATLDGNQVTFATCKERYIGKSFAAVVTSSIK